MTRVKLQQMEFIFFLGKVKLGELSATILLGTLGINRASDKWGS